MKDYENLDIVQIVLDTVASEFQEILDGDPETYGKYNVVITNERQFIKKIQVNKPNSIFIVVKFLQGNKDYGQQIQPFSLNAVTEHNSIEVCQKLMMDFSETYNLKSNFDNPTAKYTIRQTSSIPSIISNFNDVYDGFRSVLYISGTFYIGLNSNPITSIVVNGGSYEEEIDFISSQLTYDAQQDSQPFFGTNNYNRSVAKIGTLSLGFTMYAVSTDFYNDAMKIVFNKGGNVVDINKTFTIKITMRNGEIYTIDMKLASVSNVQELRDFPASSFSFVR